MKTHYEEARELGATITYDLSEVPQGSYAHVSRDRIDDYILDVFKAAGGYAIASIGGGRPTTRMTRDKIIEIYLANNSKLPEEIKVVWGHNSRREGAFLVYMIQDTGTEQRVVAINSYSRDGKRPFPTPDIIKYPPQSRKES